MYPQGTDVRRIDMCIGEKGWWGRGAGTLLVAMLVRFAFCREHVDVLHCLCEDYSVRSCRVWEKNGFSLVRQDPLPQSQKGRFLCHFRLTSGEYARRGE